MNDASLKSYSTLRRTGLLAATVSTLAIWFFYLFVGFDAIDGGAYDLLLSLKNKVLYQRPRVVLVSAESLEHPSSDETLTVAQKLRAMGASTVAFIGLPTDGTVESERSLAAMQKEGTIVFSSPATYDPSGDTYKPFSTNSQTPRLLSRPSVAAVPAISGGVYRHQRRTYDTDERLSPSLENEVASVCELDVSTSEAFLIHYAGASGSLPNIRLDDVMRDATIPELVRDRVALVALSIESTTPTLTTPGSGNAKLSRLEFHGHAINTLLKQNEIQLVGPYCSFGILMLTAGMTLAICQSIRLVVAARIVLLFSVLAVVLAFGVLCWHNLWLPVVPILLVQVFTLAAVYDQRMEFLSSGVQRLAIDIDSRVKNNPAPDTQSKDSPWMEIVMYLRQSLDIHRMVIFDLGDNTHRLQEVELHNCSFEDIKERRRDWRRTPFSWATSEKRCISLTARRCPFLNATDVEEEQFLAPLIIGSRIIGFIVLAVEKSYVESFPDFTKLLQDYSNQIVDRLYQHHCTRARTLHETGWNPVGELPEQNAYNRLAESATQLERRLLRLDELFEKSEIASAVFGVSGELLTANACMSLLIEQQGHVISNLRLIDLLSTLTGSHEEESRRRIRTVLRSKQPTSVMVRLVGQQNPFMLRVRPLTNDHDGTGGESHHHVREWSTFEVHGVVCELIDQTPFMEICQRSDAIADDLEHSVCNQLAAVEFATAMLVDSYDDEESREDFQQIIHEQVAEAATNIRAAQSTVKGISNTTTDVLALEPLHSLEKAVGRMEETSQGIKIKWNRDQLKSHVLADFDLLVDTFEAALKVIVAGVNRPAAIEVTAEESIDRVMFTIRERLVETKDLFLQQPTCDAKSTGPTTVLPGCERFTRLVAMCGGTLHGLGEQPGWNLSFSLPRFF